MKLYLISGALAIAGVIGAAALLSQPVSANGLNGQNNGSGYGQGNGNGYQVMLETKAEILGTDAGTLTSEAQTKTMAQIVEEKGMTLSEFHEEMRAQKTEQWKAMGFSDEEIATRTQRMQERQSNCTGEGMMGQHRNR